MKITIRVFTEGCKALHYLWIGPGGGDPPVLSIKGISGQSLEARAFVLGPKNWDEKGEICIPDEDDEIDLDRFVFWVCFICFLGIASVCVFWGKL